MIRTRIPLIIFAFVVFAISGCNNSGLNTEPLGFRFVDAITGQPVAGTEVTVRRRATREAFADQSDAARTGQSGKAILNLRPAPYIDVITQAPGYQPINFELERSRQGISLNGLPRTLATPVDPESDSSFGPALAWNVALVPDPPLEFRLIIPDGFRGVVRIVYPNTPVDMAPGLEGQRDTPRSELERSRFDVITVTRDGYAHLPDTWLTHTPHTFTAVDARGAIIPGPEGAMARGRTETDIRFRGGIDLLKSDFFVVGSLREYEKALAQELRLDR